MENNPVAYPGKVYVELTTRCNLQCEMCVKYMEDSSISEGDMPLATFTRLLPDLAYADTLILNGIGEPLLHPDLNEMVSMAAETMGQDSTIGFQSNGLLLDESRCRELLAAGLGTVCLSVDSLPGCGDAGGIPCGTRNGKEHSFISVQRALKNLRAARVNAKKEFRLGLEIVLSRENYRDLPQLVRWAAENDVDYIITTNLILYDRKSEQSSLFNPNFQWAAELFERYKAKAASQGVDLKSAFAHYRRFAGTRSNSLEYTILSQFQKEARTRDVRLNLEGLFHYSELAVAEVAEHFEQAAKVAEQQGMELFLPPLQALDQRRCPFVEDKAVCINVHGHVMPCHFLWHNYSCRVLQEQIEVQEKVMGDINSSSLAEIWRQSDFQQFRKEAGEYEYAPCWSCSMAPCTNLINENTSGAHDCYGSQVPCGHCQWSLGGIRCL